MSTLGRSRIWLIILTEIEVDYEAIFQNVSPEIATLLIAMLPVAELRGAIPVALGAFDLSIPAAYMWAVIGNLIPAVLLLRFLEPVSKWLSGHSTLMDRFFQWLFARTRRKFEHKYERWGTLALTFFVAIPLPVTGAWTGSIAAFLFGIPFKKAFPAVVLGVLIAGVIVTLATQGFITIL